MRGISIILCILLSAVLTADVNDDLLSAFDRGDIKAIDDALSRGANANAKDADGFTALMYAAAFGKKDYITALIAKGADTSPKANKGMTLAMAHAASGAIPELTAALGRGVNDKRFDGRTALMYAAMNKELAAMKLLIAAGADIHARDADGWTAVMFLCANDKKASKRVTIGRPRGTAKAVSPGLTALEFLAASGANLKEKTPDHFTTLMYASINNDVPLAQYLIRKGVEVDALNDDDRSALMYAAMNNNAEMVKMFIAEGADVNVRNSDLWTSLMYACATEKQVIAADAAAKDRSLSSVKNNLETISALLRARADLQARNKQGGTALLYAAENANAAAVSMIVSEASVGAFNALSYIINTPNLDGITPLMFAVMNGNRDTAALLLEKGADVNAQDLNGMTALMIAARDGDDALTKLITDALPTLGTTDMNGWGPLYYASLGGHMQAASILISRNTPVTGRELKAMYEASSPVINALRTSKSFRERSERARRLSPPEPVVSKYGFGLISLEDIPALKALPRSIFEQPYADDWLFDTMPLETVLTLAEIAPAVKRDEGIAILRILTNFDGGDALLTNYQDLRNAYMRAFEVMLVDRRLRSAKPSVSMHEGLRPFLRRASRALPTKPERQAAAIEFAVEKIALEYGDIMNGSDIKKMRETKVIPSVAALYAKKYGADKEAAALMTNTISRNAPRELTELLIHDAYLFSRDTPWLAADKKVLASVIPVYWEESSAPMTYFDPPAFEAMLRDALRFGDAAEFYPIIRKSRFAAAAGYEKALGTIGRYAAGTNRAGVIDALLAFTPAVGMTKAEIKMIAESPAAEGKQLTIVNAGKPNETWKFGRYEVSFTKDIVSAVASR